MRRPSASEEMLELAKQILNGGRETYYAEQLAKLVLSGKAASNSLPDTSKASAVASKTHPVPMLLWCPLCFNRHIDTGEFKTKPHHTHACQECGMGWRPAIVPTVGVLYLPGFKNEPATGSGSKNDSPEEKLVRTMFELGMSYDTIRFCLAHAKIGKAPNHA